MLYPIQDIIAGVKKGDFLFLSKSISHIENQAAGTDAFIAATSFPAFPMTAKLAFLLFGPMFDLKLYWLYGLLFKRKAVVLLALGLFAAVALICWRLAILGF